MARSRRFTLADAPREPQTSLEARLSRLDRDQLLHLLQQLVVREPKLTELIDELLIGMIDTPARSASAGRSASHQSRKTAGATTSIRQQIRRILHSLDRMRASEAYWYVGGVAEGVRELAEQARPHIEAGDGRTALAILEVVTDEYVKGWTELDDSDGELGAVFDDLGALWTEATLIADLSPTERHGWAERLADWQSATADYGIDTAFEAAQAGAIQGWDDAELQRVLRGESASFNSEAAWTGPRLAIAGLNVLERQGRLEEALHLADATRQVDRYLLLLVRLGRLAEARRYGLERLTQAHDAQMLAQTLLDHGAPVDALDIAEHGLSLAGDRWTLACWLRDTAAAAGDPDRATRAALVAIRESRGLDDYQAVEAVAGDRWPTLRDKVLAELRQVTARAPTEVAEIFVYEGLLDDAIAVVNSAPYDYSMVEHVADAAIETHPDWVIRMGRQQAERIMDSGQSRYYHHAVGWLERSRAAALSAGRQDDWRQYVDGLLAQHARKYALVPRLKQLRA